MRALLAEPARGTAKAPSAPRLGRARQRVEAHAPSEPARFDFASVSILPAGLALTQPLLEVGKPDDPLEREADAVAERIVAGAEPAAVPGAVAAPVQRMCVECEDDETRSAEGKRPEEADPLVSGKGPAPEMTTATDARIRGLNGGRPLGAAELEFFEPRFGHSFADVRVHTDADAAAATHAIGARAFTHGRDIAFAPGEYAPAGEGGRRLLAHELTHVVQQSARVAPSVQRELATPPPAVAPAAQPELTDAEIQAALRFNRSRYDAAGTRLIQDLVGTEPTGVWTEDDIVAIGQIQEEFGLKKDGIVGPTTFRFLDREVAAEGLPRTDANCLSSFFILGFPQVDAGTAGGLRTVSGHFRMNAQFSAHCGCADYQYRQFIRGHVIQRPAGGGAPIDHGGIFTLEPAGRLNTTFDEDGDTSAAAVNYGHREQVAEAAPVNRYIDNAGTVDQAAGCRYEGEDFPSFSAPFAAGDTLDAQISFRGEIQRAGRVVRTLEWTAVRGNFT